MIRPKLYPVQGGTILTANLVNSIINRIEYAADLLRQYKLIAGEGMYVEPHYDGTRISYLQKVAGGATPTTPPSSGARQFFDNLFYLSSLGTEAGYAAIRDLINSPEGLILDMAEFKRIYGAEGNVVLRVTATATTLKVVAFGAYSVDKGYAVLFLSVGGLETRSGNIPNNAGYVKCELPYGDEINVSFNAVYY